MACGRYDEEGTEGVEGPAKADGVSKPGWGWVAGTGIVGGVIIIEPAIGVRYRWEERDDCGRFTWLW